MESFELLRYIKKWRWLIVALMVAGVYFVYSYANGNQTYSATAYIQYTNANAALGVTPNGAALDVNEIVSSSVISDVISDLGLNCSIESVRRSCKITEIIPAEEQTKIDVALENGEDYSYFPIVYKITYTCSSNYSTTYALRMLDAIIDNYFEFYSENYINSVATPNNAVNVNLDEYDYLECVEILDGTVNELTDFLNAKGEQSWTYRASSTGYTFRDLSDIYEYYQEYTIPGLYAYILENAVTNNINALTEKYVNKISGCRLKMENLDSHIARLQALLIQYSDKSKQGVASKYGTTDTGEYILNNIFDYNEEISHTQTTYDQMILEYADLKVEYEQQKVEMEYAQYVLDAFNAVSVNSNEEHETVLYIHKMITELADAMNDLYRVLWATVDEYNSYRSAQDITMLTNISTHESINVTLYVTVGVVLFGCIGFFSAVILGRLGDLLEYFVYIDRHVGIYNREKCDLVIEERSHSMLAENFACMVIGIANLSSLNAQLGREKCDAMQKQFAKFLNENVQRHDGFTGYNGRGQFISLLDDTSSARAKDIFDFIVKTYVSVIEESSGTEMAQAFDFHVGISCSSEDDQYQIRDLLRTAVKRSQA